MKEFRSTTMYMYIYFYVYIQFHISVDLGPVFDISISYGILICIYTAWLPALGLWNQWVVLMHCISHSLSDVSAKIRSGPFC